MKTESPGALGSTTRNAVFCPRPPVSDVRATVRGPAMWTRHPSYRSANEFDGLSFNCVVVPAKNGGSGLPEETLRTMPFGAVKLLFGASTRVALWNSSVRIHSTTSESPTWRLYGA